LPLAIEYEDLKPGDLIFYSGTYYEKKKSRAHNMTHVEIYLGEGRSIGARRKRGVI
jgi:cell wall-associated NlpC family hydrolase